mmetsp:Transcript_85995/g.238205  ORF Transcript_85995/g.238205 Transcript_85995/m.238205 type:complete len:213 (+) Transcript_85995:74-712(+)
MLHFAATATARTVAGSRGGQDLRKRLDADPPGLRGVELAKESVHLFIRDREAILHHDLLEDLLADVTGAILVENGAILHKFEHVIAVSSGPGRQGETQQHNDQGEEREPESRIDAIRELSPVTNSVDHGRTGQVCKDDRNPVNHEPHDEASKAQPLEEAQASLAHVATIHAAKPQRDQLHKCQHKLALRCQLAGFEVHLIVDFLHNSFTQQW